MSNNEQPKQHSLQQKLDLRRAIESRLYVAVRITMDDNKAKMCVNDLCKLHSVENDDGNGERSDEVMAYWLYVIESELMKKYGVKE